LQDLQDYLEDYNLEFPISPLSKEIATIGGMIATNAIGNRSLKYGRTENWINWIEIINCNGDLEKKGLTEISDYSGMEGTTGIIVRACLRLVRKKQRTASVITTESFEEIISIVKNLKRNSNISMTKFLDKWLSKKLNLGGGYNLIIEYEDDSGNLKGKEYLEILNLIDEIYPTMVKGEYLRIEDPKILIDKFPIFMRWLEIKKIPSFGDISSGILHPCFNNQQEKLIPEMVRLIKRLGGQISSVYGVGILKKGFVEINDQKILRNVKKRTDPLNKFNPGKLI
jgi:FAD/FMN-containing dehydrogenase